MPPSGTLTPRDLEIAGLVFQCLKSDIVVDYEKLAALAGLKNAKTANAVWGPIKKKLIAGGTSNGAGTGATPKKTEAVKNAGQGTPSRTSKRTPKPTAKSKETYAESSDEDEDETVTTPTPKRVSPMKRKTPVQGDGNGEGTVSEDEGVADVEASKRVKKEDSPDLPPYDDVFVFEY